MKLFFLVLSLFFIQFSQAQVTPAEKAALQAFYNATDGPNWISENDGDLTNDWNFGGVVTNDWFGLTIAGGNVLSINMNPANLTEGGNNLTGIIPNEIGNLPHLVTLNLAAENLMGDLPMGLFNLSELQLINLRSNEITGNIPPEISQLTNLISLQLYDNDLIGEIPVELTTLNLLEDIQLSNNNLFGEIPIEITNMIQLRILDLNNNPFTGFLYPEYGNLVNLETFFLYNNLLTGSIPNEIGDMSNLEFLWLGGNNLNGTLPTSLGNLTNLKVINISFTGISGSIPVTYGQLVNIQRFLLNNNQLSDELPGSLANLTQIITFKVDHNQLSGELPTSYDQWVLIEKFEVGNNQFTGNIPDSYANLTNLTHFSVDYNNLSGELSPLFSSWDKLVWLNLQDNNFSGPIPETYSNLTSIESLNIANNQFSGELSPSFSNWSNAKALFFQNNQFEGAIPDFTSVLTLGPSGNKEDALSFNGNQFQFGDFENEFNHYDQELFGFFYSPQAKVNDMESFSSCEGSNITLSTMVSGSANEYQWFKNGNIIEGATNADLVLNPLDTSDSGTYTCNITSTIVTDLTLERNPISLTVNADGPTANSVENIVACDLDADGFTSFNIDLTQVESQVIGAQNGLTVSYYDTTGNPLTLTTNYTNSSANEEVITVRVTDSGGCYNESTFSLIAAEPITADDLDDVISCNSYELPELNTGNSYFTEPNASGTQLQEGTIITNSQTIYIHTGVANCSDETSFNVTINSPAIVDELNDVTACEFYTLPKLDNGSYFTESNGQGSELAEGDTILQTQTIYIYNTTTNCSNESSFLVTIDLLSCENSDEAILAKFPKFFTPNADGIHDVWKVNQDFFSLEGSITIYNRFGKLLAQFNAENGSWDGNYNGKSLPASDYWFMFNGVEGNSFTGHFSLKR